MDKTNSRLSGYILAAALGALGGSLIVLWATKAIPKMTSQMMTGMMQNIMAQMKENGGCNCSEMCQQMQSGCCSEAHPEEIPDK